MQTPTQLLMKCLEDFGESESTVAIVVYRQDDGTISCRASGEQDMSVMVGMLECAKAVVLDQLVRQAKGD